MNRSFKILCSLLLLQINATAQEFGYLDPQLMSLNFSKPFKVRQVYTTSWGCMLFGSSLGLGKFEDNRLGFQIINLKNPVIPQNVPNVLNDYYVLSSGIKCIAEGPEKIVYVVSDNNNLGWIDFNKEQIIINYPPFNWPASQHIDIKKIWIDPLGNLYAATTSDTLYSIPEATKVYSGVKTINYMIDKNGVVVSGEKRVEKSSLGPNIIPTCFAASEQGDEGIYIGTSQGILFNNKWNGTIENLFEKSKLQATYITKIETVTNSSEIWFSTVGKGMGMTNDGFSSVEYFPYDKNNKRTNSIPGFTRIADHFLFVAIADSSPAFFNVLNGEYQFKQDTSFNATKNSTSDVSVNHERRLFFIKDLGLYMGGDTLLSKETLSDRSRKLIRPVLIGIEVNGNEYRTIKNYEGNYDALKAISLKYYEYKLSLDFVMKGANLKDTVFYEWKLDGYQEEWQRIKFTMLENKFGRVEFDSLKPGRYVFRVRARLNNEQWLETQIKLVIVIDAPFWQTWWFWSATITGLGLIIGILLWWQGKVVKRKERERFAHEKQILELEARSLRAQMNPHFIFNCMNSIKSLMQEGNIDKGVAYLTTFSKLIRTLFNNADKKDISLYDEIETCKYYLQLEAMRFDAKFSYSVNVDENSDLKSIQVPALIIQPFIENAIWHGIVPRGWGGNVSLDVTRKEDAIQISIDDDGIGREASAKNRSVSNLTHQSKGVNLTQTRLELNNLLQQRQAVLETIDKKDEQGNSTGTTVIIKIKEELS